MGKMLKWFKIPPLKPSLCIPVFTINSAKAPVIAAFF